MRKNKQFKIKLFKKNIYIFTKKKRKRNLLFAYLHIEESYRIQTKQTTFREKETSISKNILCTVYFHFSKTDNDVSSLIETRLIRPFRATQVERILSARPTFLRSSTRATKAFLPLLERVEDKFYNVRVLQISPEPVSPLSPAGSSRGINKFRPLDRRGGKWIKSAAKWRRGGGRSDDKGVARVKLSARIVCEMELPSRFFSSGTRNCSS